MSSDMQENKKRFKGKKKKRRVKKNDYNHSSIHNRGVPIDEDEYNYFVNILNETKRTFEDLDEKVTMANNVFEHTEDRAVHFASNATVSMTLESLIGFVDSKMMESYFEKFGDNLRPLCSDKFASHVLQKMLEISFLRFLPTLKSESNPECTSKTKKIKLMDHFNEEWYNRNTEFSEDHRQNCGNFVLRVSKFLLNNLEDYVWDPYGNHVMRTCILCLAGMHVDKRSLEKFCSDLIDNHKIYEVPNEWSEIAIEYAKRLQMWPQFIDLPYERKTSGLLAIISIALKTIDKSESNCFNKKILNIFLTTEIKTKNDDKKTFDTEIVNEISQNGNTLLDIQLPKVFLHQSSIWLLEILITVATPKLFKGIYKNLFMGRFRELAINKLTNFAVQKLLFNVNDKEDFENIFKELQEHVEELLKIGHTGMIVSMTSACLRLQKNQAQLMASLHSALHIADHKERFEFFFYCLLKLKPYDDISEYTNWGFVQLHGSLIIQDLLNFNKPILLVKCILDTSTPNLIKIFSNNNGSHICDAFLQSKYVGEKSREKLINHLEGFYVDLAITKMGSRVVESCFFAAKLEQKIKIVKELNDKVNMVKGSLYGTIIYYKLRVNTFRISIAQWKANLPTQQTETRKQVSKGEQLFKDIIINK